MKSLHNSVVAIANQKGGVGKTTTTVNLAQAFTIKLPGSRVAVIDFDPQGNSTQASGITLETVRASVSDLIRDRSFPDTGAIYKGASFDLIPATPVLAQVEREMVGMTNSELRLAQRIKKLRTLYSIIIIDTPPSFGPLMNSALNAADGIIIPVDSNVFALHGIRTLLAEIEEIRSGTNPNLKLLGFLITLSDSTRITAEVSENLKNQFGNLVFKTPIRKSVKLREAPALGRTIFHHAPTSSGAEDYLNLAGEILERIKEEKTATNVYPISPMETNAAQGVSHE